MAKYHTIQQLITDGAETEHVEAMLLEEDSGLSEEQVDELSMALAERDSDAKDPKKR
jgi:hypothetical protein